MRLGRIYRPVRVLANNRERLVVAFVDSGADETVISQRLARELGVELYGVYRAYTVTGEAIEGRFAEVTFKDEKIEITMEVGVSDAPFESEYSDEEGVDVIIGVDFLQDAGIKLVFSR